MTPTKPLRHLMLDYDMSNQNECDFIAHIKYLISEYSGMEFIPENYYYESTTDVFDDWLDS